MEDRGSRSSSYLRRTTATSLGPSAHHETTVIRNNFSTGSVVDIQRLPLHFQAGNVIKTRNNTIHENLSHSPSLIFRPAGKIHRLDLASHSFNDYSKPSMLNRLMEEDHKHQLASFARKPFVVPAQGDSLRRYVFSQDDYQGIKGLHNLTRNPKTNRSKFLFGDFQSTCGKHRFIQNPNSQQVQSWVQEIHDSIAKDWGRFRFSLQYTIDNQLIVSFENKDLPPANALLNYMNHSSVHGVIGALGFIRRGDRWYVLENNQVVFGWYALGMNKGPLQIFKQTSAASRKNTVAHT